MYTENETQIEAPEKNTSYASLIHLSSFLGFIIPFGGIITPLILWINKKNEDNFIDEHGKACLNFEISLLIYSTIIGLLSIIGFILFGINIVIIGNSIHNQMDDSDKIMAITTVIIIGIFLLLSSIFYIILKIIGAINASNGKLYKYPLAISLIK